MTDTDRIVDWLRKAMDAAQQLAEAAAQRAWSPRWEWDPCVREIRDLNNGNTLANLYHPEIGNFVEANDPAAVLRRIDRDRETLEDCENAIIGWTHQETKELAQDTIRNLAEAWGWTEETT